MDLLENSSVDLLDGVKAQANPPSNAYVGKTALYTSIANGNPDSFLTITDDLTTQGFSVDVEETVASLKEMRQLEARQFVSEVASGVDASVEEVKNLVLGLRPFEQESTPDKVLGVAALEKVLTDTNVNVETLWNHKQARDLLNNSLGSRIEESPLLANVAELGAAIVTPFSDQMLLLGIVPEEAQANIFKYMASNEGKVAVREKYESLPIEKKTEVLLSFNELSKNLAETTGITILPAGLIGDVLDPEYEGSFWYYLDGVISVLDAAAVTKLAAAPFRAIKAGKIVTETRKYTVTSPENPDVTNQTAPMNTIPAVNPESGQEIIKAALAADESAEALAGVKSSAEVYNARVIPKYSDVGRPADTEGMPSAYSDYEVYAARLQAEIFNTASTAGVQLTKQEQEAQQLILKSKLENNVNGISLREASTTIIKTEDGFDVAAVYGKSSVRGWNNFAIAVEETAEATAKFGVSLDDINVMVKMPDGQLKTVTSGEVAELMKSGKELDIYTSVNYTKYWDSTGVGKFQEGSTDWLNRTVSKMTTWGGKYSNWLVNSVNRYDKSITSVINVMKDRGTGVTGMLVDMVKPLTGLNTSSKQKIVALLREGDALSKKYSPAELRVMVQEGKLTDKEAVAVLSNYKFWDTVYLLDNRAYAKHLQEKGYWLAKGVDNEGLEFTLVGKPTEKVPEGTPILNIGDNTSYTGSLEGMRIVKLKDATRGADGNSYKFAVIPAKSDYRAFKATDNALEYREGYYPRRYRGDYYIDREVRDAKGNVVEIRSVGNVESLTKGQNYVNSLSKEAGVTYTVRASQELQKARSVDEDAFENLGVFSDVENGRSIQRHRGSHLAGYNDKDLLDLAPTLDPFESMMNSAFNTGRISLHQDAIGALENRWLKTFGDLLDGQGYPDKTPVFRKGDEAKVKKALDMYHYIEKQKEVVDTYLTKRLFKMVVTNTAEVLDNLNLGLLSNALRTQMISDFDPVKMVRSAAFLAYIVGNPTRQALLQTAQLAQMMPLTMKYANPKRLLQDTFALKATAVSSIDAKAYADTIAKSAKSMGISIKEMETIAENFRKSGLPFSVDSNNLVEGLQRGLGGEIYDSKFKSFASSAIHASKAPLRIAKRVGFDWGELNNLSGTYMVALERMRKGRPISQLTQRQWAEIGDEARRLSWNMTNVDNFSYQTGLISIPLQFAQVFHKALLTYALGNRTLTVAERGRVVAFNTVFLTGTLSSVYYGFFADALEEAPQEVKEGLEKGLLNLVVNQSIEGAYAGLADKDIDVDINLGGLSPALGLLEMPTETLGSLLEGDLFGAPGLQAINRGADYLHKSWNMFTKADFGMEIETPERALKATVTALSMFSGVNNMNKALIATSLEKQYFLNSKLQPVAESNVPELIAHGLFGLPPSEMEDMYKITKALYGNGKYTATDARQIAEFHYDIMRRFTIGEAREEELMALEFVMKSIRDSDYDTQKLIAQEVLKLDRQSQGTTQDRLFSQLLRNNSKLTKDQVEQVRRWIHMHGNDNKGTKEMFEMLFKEE